MEEQRKAIYAGLTAFAFVYLTTLQSVISEPGALTMLATYTAHLGISIAAGIGGYVGAYFPANKVGGQNVIDLAKKNVRMTEDAVNPVPVDYIKGEKP